MKGKTIKIVEYNKIFMYLFELETRECGRTYTGEDYRNYVNWKDLKVGDQVDGLQWKDKNKKLLDGDSPVYIIR